MSAVMMLLSPGEAQRLTQRIKLIASSVRDNLFKLQNLVEEAKNSNVWQVLGYQSWTAYLADTLADEPMRLGRDERQALVGYLAGEGLSVRAIAPIVGADPATVSRDRARVANATPVRPVPVVSDTHHEFPTATEWTPDTGFVTPGDALNTADPIAPDAVGVPDPIAPKAPEPRAVTGLDGKTYPQPAEPKIPRRAPITESARNAGYDVRKLAERLQRIAADDRFTRNKEEVASLIRGHLMFTVEVCQDLLNTFNQSERTDS